MYFTVFLNKDDDEFSNITDGHYFFEGGGEVAQHSKSSCGKIVQGKSWERNRESAFYFPGPVIYY